MTTLFGLPGMYQNWTMTALDPAGSYLQENKTNFVYTGKLITFKEKLESFTPDLNDQTVVNLYVKSKNFVWYLYNFFEKTDSVGIQIDFLENDLLSKAAGTVAFNGMLKHFIQSYQISSDTQKEVIKDSLIEYFYFTLIQDTAFKKIAGITCGKYINLEYNNFENVELLAQALSGFKNLDLTHLEKMYKILISANSRFINKRREFLHKINSHDINLDILETAYVGALLYWNNNKQLDWFNSNVRYDYLSKSTNLIRDLANNV